MRKITVIIILIMIYSFSACVSSRTITHTDEIKNTLESESRFYLHTNKSQTYYFDWPYTYKLYNDTLIGWGKIVIDNSKVSSKYVTVNLENIQKIEIVESDAVKTVIAFGITGAVVYIIYYALKSSFENMTIGGK